MQRGLIDDRAAQDGCPVAILGETHSVKPGRPSSIQMPFEADFVLSGFVTIARRCVCFAHCAPFACRPTKSDLGRYCGPSLVQSGSIRR